MKRSAMLVIALSLLPSSASAQQPAPTRRERVWVDVNFLSQHPSQGEQTYSATFLVFPSALVQATTTTTYPAFPSTFGMGFDAGVLLHEGFGVGMHFDRAKYNGSIALAVTVPNPVDASRPVGTDSAVTETPETRETAFDLSAVYALRLGGSWQVRVFGGPSYLSITQSMLNHYSYSQAFSFSGPLNTVDISGTSFRTEEVTEAAWGFHAGADVQYFFTRHFGVGGVVRMNRAIVSLTEPLTQVSTDVRLGHVSVGGGLRLKF